MTKRTTIVTWDGQPLAGGVIDTPLRLLAGDASPELVWPASIPAAAFPVARLIDTGDGYYPELYLASAAGHTCIACGLEHAGCCGQCPHYRPPTTESTPE